MSEGTCYLLHFSRPLGNTANVHGMAQHYIGHADDLGTRLRQHRSGNGARIMAAVEREGIGWQVVRTWPGGRDLERRLKARHRAADFCPVCKAEG